MSPVARPRRLPAARRRDQLLAAALESFGGSGFHDTSMDDIAGAAGVTKPVLYQHFGSKRTLYGEVLETVGAEMVATIAERAATAADPRGRVLRGFEAYFEFVCEHPNSWQVLFNSAARQGEDFSEVIERLEREVATMIGGFIDAGIDDEHRRLLGYGIVGLAEVTARQWIRPARLPGTDRYGPLDRAEGMVLAGRLADLVWAGLRALPEADPPGGPASA